jgi:hypothetical protein
MDSQPIGIVIILARAQPASQQASGQACEDVRM